MKKNLLMFIPLVAMATLVGCNNSNSGLKPKKGDVIYESRLVYDLSDETDRTVSVKIGKDKAVSKIQCGRVSTEDKKYMGGSKGILTISSEFMKQVPAGEKDIVVTYNDKSVETVDAFVATKVLKTAEDFQGIQNNPNGTYILGNDIDCSSIANFEPIGVYYTETDTRNAYFHGILDGNGYKVSNINCSYSEGRVGTSDSGYPSNYDVYTETTNAQNGFEELCHKAGDNVGIFQVIGSSGVIRNLTFDNCYVHGRTIVGVIAGNNMGLVENCLVTQSCRVLMDTHFWDDDCNCGAAFGIVAGSGVVNNVVSLATNVQVRGTYEDYSDEYIGNPGTGYDHGGNTQNNFWRFWGANKVDGNSAVYTDSNGKNTNGCYSFAGKCWGEINNSVAASFNVSPYGQDVRAVCFSQYHVGDNKPDSGATDLGTITNCDVYSQSDLKLAATYSSFDNDVWNIVEGSFPSINQPVIKSTIYGE